MRRCPGSSRALSPLSSRREASIDQESPGACPTACDLFVGLFEQAFVERCQAGCSSESHRSVLPGNSGRCGIRSGGSVGSRLDGGEGCQERARHVGRPASNFFQY